MELVTKKGKIIDVSDYQKIMLENLKTLSCKQ
jgi:hypothetical protein